MFKDKKKKKNNFTWQDSNTQLLSLKACALPLCHSWCPQLWNCGNSNLKWKQSDQERSQSERDASGQVEEELAVLVGVLLVADQDGEEERDEDVAGRHGDTRQVLKDEAPGSKTVWTFFNLE